MTEVNEVIDTIKDILEDSGIQKNIKQKLERVIQELSAADKKTLKLKVDKCIDEMDEICNDGNIQPFIRTQIWSIVSMLESLE
ncbi:UPF0147 family protein [Candidatus Woesearchaeota archaeon]|nr:UPF0147 family protein [Candidatus Woesearchaeota archaeon]